MTQREVKNCVVCRRQFLVGGRPGIRRKSGRNPKSVTCSPKCSREYNSHRIKYKE